MVTPNEPWQLRANEQLVAPIFSSGQDLANGDDISITVSQQTTCLKRYEKASTAIWYETDVYGIEHALGITRRSVAVAHGINPASSSWMNNNRKGNQHHHLCKSPPLNTSRARSTWSFL